MKYRLTDETFYEVDDNFDNTGFLNHFDDCCSFALSEESENLLNKCKNLIHNKFLLDISNYVSGLLANKTFNELNNLVNNA